MEERTQLREQTDKEDDRINSTIRRMTEDGSSCREIAAVTGLSAATVSRRLKKMQAES